MAGRNLMIRYGQLRGGAGYRNTRLLRGDPGFLGGLGKIVGKVAPKLLGAIPGVGTAINVASLGATALGAVRSFGKAKNLTTSLAPITGPGSVGGLATVTRGGLGKLALGAGAVGAGAYGATKVAGMIGARGERRRYRRMNPLNPKAANRAIRRIKAVRKLCRSIESSLPKQKASCSRKASFGRKR